MIGAGGRVPPTVVIEDDATGDVETSGVFDPASDGIDFYESLEGMRVQVNNPIAVGPTSGFGEIPVVADGGANAGRAHRARWGHHPPGRLQPRADDPRRHDRRPTPRPIVNVGDGFTGPAVGVLDYSFGNFKLNVTQAAHPGRQRAARGRHDGTWRRRARASRTFNVENLDPDDPPSKFDALAESDRRTTCGRPT